MGARRIERRPTGTLPLLLVTLMVGLALLVSCSGRAGEGGDSDGSSGATASSGKNAPAGSRAGAEPGGRPAAGVSAQGTSRGVATHGATRAGAAGGDAGLAGGDAGLAGGDAGPAARHRNLLLITLDTTRADHLGCYGHAGGVSPNIDRIAAEGAIAQHAIAVAPLTLPSHASILTALYPPSTGVRDNADYRL